MSLQWTLVASVMYVELFATILLLIPFISPKRWHTFFKSKFLKSVNNMADFYFKIFLGVLVLLFMDAIREMVKYNREVGDHQKEHTIHLDADLQTHMRLFRAQRNFYISGFSLFLWIVLQRLVTLISTLAVAQAEKEASMKQAKSASDAASKLLAGGKTTKEKEESSEELKELREENKRLKAEHEATLKQAEAVSKEYDRLLKEHATVQKQLEKASETQTSKKSD